MTTQCMYNNDIDILTIFFNDKFDKQTTINRTLSHGIAFDFDYNYNLLSIEIPNFCQSLGLARNVNYEFIFKQMIEEDEIHIIITISTLINNNFLKDFNIRIDCSQL